MVQMTWVVRNMFFPIMGMLVSSSLFGFNRIVEFDLDLVFCSATRTVKDWDTFDILSSSFTSFPPGSRRGGHTWAPGPGCWLPSCPRPWPIQRSCHWLTLDLQSFLKFMHIYFSAVVKAILTFYLLFPCFMHFCLSAGVRVTLAENSKPVFKHIWLFSVVRAGKRKISVTKNTLGPGRPAGLSQVILQKCGRVGVKQTN